MDQVLTDQRRPHVQIIVLAEISSTATSTSVSTATQAQSIWHASPTYDVDWLEFCLLAAQWKQDTMYSSSLRAIFSSRYYRRILEMDSDKIAPLIIRQLIAEGEHPYHWFSALISITGENPAANAGDNVRDISMAWIEWGRAHYGGKLAGK